MILSELADRTATVDIDAVVVVPADVIDRDRVRYRAENGAGRTTGSIARRRGCTRRTRVIRSGTGRPNSLDDTLAIDLATQEALLAMKLNASRRGRDDDDIQALMTVCGVHTVAEADQHFSEYFRGESMPDKAVVLLRRLGFPDGDENLYRHIPVSAATCRLGWQ